MTENSVKNERDNKYTRAWMRGVLGACPDLAEAVVARQSATWQYMRQFLADNVREDERDSMQPKSSAHRLL